MVEDAVENTEVYLFDNISKADDCTGLKKQALPE